MWEELAHYTTYQPSYVTDSTAYKKHVEEIQVFEFLICLNLEYEEFRVQILYMNLSTSLNEVYAYIHREERERGVMNVPSPIEKSTLVSTYIRGVEVVLQPVAVKEDLVVHQMMETDSNVSIVVGLGISKTNVGTSMDSLRTFPHVSFNWLGLVVVEEVVDLEVVVLVLTQLF